MAFWLGTYTQTCVLGCAAEVSNELNHGYETASASWDIIPIVVVIHPFICGTSIPSRHEQMPLYHTQLL